MAKMYHPDVNKAKDAQKKYLAINEAYQTLSDPKKRKVYDSTGMTANEQQGADINFDGFSSFSDVFRSAF